MGGTNMEATIASLARAIDAHQVAKRDLEDPTMLSRDLVNYLI